MGYADALQRRVRLRQLYRPVQRSQGVCSVRWEHVEVGAECQEDQGLERACAGPGQEHLALRHCAPTGLGHQVLPHRASPRAAGRLLVCAVGRPAAGSPGDRAAADREGHGATGRSEVDALPFFAPSLHNAATWRRRGPGGSAAASCWNSLCTGRCRIAVAPLGFPGAVAALGFPGDTLPTLGLHRTSVRRALPRVGPSPGWHDLVPARASRKHGRQLSRCQLWSHSGFRRGTQADEARGATVAHRLRRPPACRDRGPDTSAAGEAPSAHEARHAASKTSASPSADVARGAAGESSSAPAERVPVAPDQLLRLLLWRTVHVGGHWHRSRCPDPGSVRARDFKLRLLQKRMV
mmetsp:Transcript_148019/g.475272  ORF Transcript_148019/g.475272 Transcript_148019/m.475272 type:complete len:351 (+) Transcript_148019:359-1411(+)